MLFQIKASTFIRHEQLCTHEIDRPRNISDRDAWIVMASLYSLLACIDGPVAVLLIHR